MSPHLLIESSTSDSGKKWCSILGQKLVWIALCTAVFVNFLLSVLFIIFFLLDEHVEEHFLDILMLPISCVVSTAVFISYFMLCKYSDESFFVFFYLKTSLSDLSPESDNEVAYCLLYGIVPNLELISWASLLQSFMSLLDKNCVCSFRLT